MKLDISHEKGEVTHTHLGFNITAIQQFMGIASSVKEMSGKSIISN
jgi:hypothetical protein